MTAAAHLPQDPALPHLALALDAQAVASHLAQELHPHGRTVEACQVERVKYRPRRNCTLLYRLRVRDAEGAAFDQLMAARLCAPGEAALRAARAAAASLVPSAAGPALRLLPDLGLLSWWWPNDPRLAAPRVLSDAQALQHAVLPEVAAALGAGRAGTEIGTFTGTRTGAVTGTVTVAQYVPEQRLTAAVDLHWARGSRQAPQRVYAKCSREPGSEAAHQLLQRLNESPACRAGRLHLPRALLWQAASGLHWQSALPGLAWQDLPAGRARALAPALGAQLAALHATPMTLPRHLTPPVLRERLQEVVALLATALPASRPALQAAARALEAGLVHAERAPLATLHGDLHSRNILVDGDAPGFIDLDGLRTGPALLELGAWVADLQYRALLERRAPLADAAVWQGLLEGHAGAGGARPSPAALAWATAWNLLTQRAWRCVVNLKPGRFAIAPRLVELAAAALDSRPALEAA